MYHGFAKFIRGKVFSLLFTVLSVLSMVYLSVKIGDFANYIWKINIHLVVFLLFAGMFTYMFLFFKSSKKVKKTRKCYEFCGCIACFFLNLLLFSLAYDIVFCFLSNKSELWYLIPTGSALCLCIYGYIHAKRLYVKRYSVSLEQGGHPINMVLLSDIHTGTFVNRKQLHKIVDRVNSLDPDIVVITGDTFDVGAFEISDLPVIAEELQRIHTKEGAYAILGNHDPSSQQQEIVQFFKKTGIRLLIDEVIEKTDFYLVGRDDMITNPERKKLSILLEGCENKPVILLDHNPSGIKEGIENKAALVLCGHTHRGQFFPVNLVTELAYGKQAFYGYARQENTQSIVSAGTGYFQMPVRIGTNSEIVQIDIT